MRNILITGGSRGIGRACVELFRQRGDRVVFIYKSNEAAARECEEKYGATGLMGDVSDPNNAARLCDEALGILGNVDVLVNNAGISLCGLFTEMSDLDWRRITDTNLSSAFYMSKSIAPQMIRRRSGKIINIGSVWGRCGASCEAAYSASKAGLRGLTLSLAKELGPSGITVNCVEPGVIDTDMNSAHDEETMKALADDTPLCRIGNPSDVAHAIAFLASPDADFITGQILGVDGGFGI